MRWFPSSSRTLPSQDRGLAQPSRPASSAGHNLASIALRPLALDEAVALLAGSGTPAVGLRWHEDYPMTETVGALGMLFSAHRAAGWTTELAPSWWLHQIVLDDEVVGDIGFHGPPGPKRPVEVEIGYAVVPGLRGRGIATASCRLLLEQAWRDGAALVRAETEPGNQASATVLLRSGFQREGDLRYLIARPVAQGQDA